VPITATLSLAFSLTWGAWGLFWLLASGWSAPSRDRQPAAGRILHLAMVLGGSALLFVTPSADHLLTRPLLGTGVVPAITGLALTGLGLGFATWARITMGRMWSARVTLKEGHVIIDHGPYAFARHPIYTGLLVALLGTAAARGTLAALVGFTIIAAGLVVKLRQEEKLLLGHFGAAYEAYRGRVKGLVPLVW
jgi:protein-S-isoprenylcysteine O-methyltransferase Ste14